MKRQLQAWRHVFKLDPDRSIGDEALEAVCLSGSDAIIIGGSSGVTYDNTVDLLSRIRQYEIPCVLEVSDLEAVVPGFDLYLIPMVLNTANPDWLIGQQTRAVEQLGYMIPWDDLVPEGYIVLNPDSTVAKITEAATHIEPSTAAAYAQVADKLLRMPIVYIEYSGTFGDLEVVADVYRSIDEARLFYGGGIKDAETARQAAAVCHTIVVGNAVYSDLHNALSTVPAVKGRRN